MSIFQSYLDNIKLKTGKSPKDFKALAQKKGLLKPEIKAGAIVAWLKKDYNLGHGHAMAIYTVLKGLKEKKQDKAGMLQKHFSGEKEKWRHGFNELIKKISSFGKDIKTDIGFSYISLLKGTKKFAIIKIGRDKMTIGIKLKNQPSTNRFEPAGKWNAMVTHKVAILNSRELDKELYNWLFKAYEHLK